MALRGRAIPLAIFVPVSVQTSRRAWPPRLSHFARLRAYGRRRPFPFPFFWMLHRLLKAVLMRPAKSTLGTSSRADCTYCLPRHLLPEVPTGWTWPAHSHVRTSGGAHELATV